MPVVQSGKFSFFYGLSFAFISGILISLIAVIVKKMENIHPGQMAVYRFLSSLVFSLPGAVGSNQNMLGPRDLRPLLIFRGFFDAPYLFLNFVAFRYLPMGEAAAIIFSVPVFVTVTARIFLKEPCGIFQTITVFLAVIGIILTIKIPQKLSGTSLPHSTESLYGMLAAIASLFFSTCRFIVIRKVRNVHHAVTVFNSSWVALIETVILTFVTGEFKWHDCGHQRLYIIVLGIFSFIGQTLLTMALQCELAGPVSTMRAASNIILAFVWQTVLFHDTPDPLSVSGAVLVGISVIFVGLKKYISILPKDSPYLKYFNWLNK